LDVISEFSFPPFAPLRPFLPTPRREEKRIRWRSRETPEETVLTQIAQSDAFAFGVTYADLEPGSRGG
jgi:hypothetical protein